MSARSVFSLVVAFLALLGARPAAAQAAERTSRPNVLLVLLDDVGVEKVGAYGLSPKGAKKPCTPSLDALAREGLLFTRAWGSPVCSPTRAQILTGRHAFRTGIGTIIEHQGDEHGLSAALETTLPEILTGYDSSYVGKWHLAHPTEGGARHPIDCGFRWFAGTLFNIASPAIFCGEDCERPDCAARAPLGYTNWVRVEASADSPAVKQECVSTYATTVTADDAVARAKAMSAPWFLQVSFNAAHLPAEKPPAALLPKPGGPCGDPQRLTSARTDVLNAMITALDTELGRMLAEIRAVDPGVVVLVVGDNGTSIPAAEGAPGGCFARGRSKGTVYEGGIRVPLIAAGPGVKPGTCDALVCATDLYATVADLAGVASSAEDSVSLAPYLTGERAPRRTLAYSETFLPNSVSPGVAGQPPLAPSSRMRAIRDAQFKLIQVSGPGKAEPEKEMLFDLLADPCETKDLLEFIPTVHEKLTDEQSARLESLRAELAKLGG